MKGPRCVNGNARTTALENAFPPPELPVLTYSVEKLISCALTILQMNHSVAENQA
jgi:hypothetical protein